MEKKSEPESSRTYKHKRPPTPRAARADSSQARENDSSTAVGSSQKKHEKFRFRRKVSSGEGNEASSSERRDATAHPVNSAFRRVNRKQSASKPPATVTTSEKTSPARKRRTLRITIPDQWGRGVFAGIETAFLCWGLLVIIIFFAYVNIRENPWMSNVNFSDARRFAGQAWAASLGQPLSISGTSISAVPTLITVLMVFGMRFFLVRVRGHSAVAVATVIPSFMLCTFLLGVVTAPGTFHARAIIGSLIIPTAVYLWVAVHDCSFSEKSRERIRWILHGCRHFQLFLLITILMSFVLFLTTFIVSHEEIVSIRDLLGPADTQDIVAIVLAQLLFVPSACAWALSWLAGPGFFVGVDALHTPTSAPHAPMPEVPLFGAIPQSAPGNSVILIIVIVAICAGAYMRWRMIDRNFLFQLRESALGIGLYFIAVLVWMSLSTLVLGTGRLATIGPRPLLSAVLITLEFAFLSEIIVIVSYPGSLTFIRTKGLPYAISVCMRAGAVLQRRSNTKKTEDTDNTGKTSDHEKDNSEDEESANVDPTVSSDTHLPSDAPTELIDVSAALKDPEWKNFDEDPLNIKKSKSVDPDMGINVDEKVDFDSGMDTDSDCGDDTRDPETNSFEVP